MTQPAPQGAAPPEASLPDRHAAQRLGPLTIGALGVVYGDIGTSPLYAFRETLRAVAGPDGVQAGELTGTASLLLWTLVVIVTIKYVVLLLRVDNDGEGGAMALFALISRKVRRQRGKVLTGLAMAGIAFFFGDSMLTPAISVLSAIEGAAVIEPGLEPLVIPAAVGVLGALFAFQAKGSARISTWFGPVMAVWFVTLGLTGIIHLAARPEMLAALSPFRGLGLLANHPGVGLAVLGGVFLCVTGAEALYADLGHFGRRPISLAWLGLVLPCLSLNYLGQGALVLEHPDAAADPFFRLAAPSLMPALVALSTAATVIAAQSVITGAFSLGRQALLLGLMPRLTIVHTSEAQQGQIYIPALNWMMMLGTIWIMTEFDTSSALASAYGVAVLGSMLMTTLLATVYLIRVRRIRWPLALVIAMPFLTIEGAFGAANLVKLHEGGWVPLALAAAIMTLMGAWVRGTGRISAKAAKNQVALAPFVAKMETSSAARVSGTAVFLTANDGAVPPALLHNLKHNKVLHEQNAILTVEVRDRPTVPQAERAQIEAIGPGFVRLRLAFGFMETPNISRALGLLRDQGFRFDVMSTSFFLGRRRFVAGQRQGLRLLADRLFVILSRLAADPIDYFYLPRDRVVEIGARLSL